MAKKWDRMTKQAWEKSEVMKEFESRILESVEKFRSIAGIIADTEKATDSIQKANESAKELVTTLSQNLAEDEDSDITDDEFNEAKDSLIEELTHLSYAAADEKNIKLAYQIERTIFELEELFEEN